jgi:hypothetical protein
MASRTRGRLAVVRTAVRPTLTRRAVIEATSRTPIVGAMYAPVCVDWNVVPLCPRDAPRNVIFLHAVRLGHRGTTSPTGTRGVGALLPVGTPGTPPDVA